MEFKYRGLIAPVFTPFTDDMVVNANIINEYAAFLNKSGVNGILVNGSTGEGPSLSKDERKFLAEKWKQAVNTTKQHLMVQVGGAPLPDVLEMAKHAEQTGVDSILCLPELYFKPRSPEELIQYLKEVSEAAPKTPLLYYHIPRLTNVTIHMGDFLTNEMIKKIPTFCGIKFTSTCLDEGLSAVQSNNGKFAVFLGADSVIAGACTLGFDSVIATTLNICPQLIAEIVNAVGASELEKARNKQNLLNLVVKLITQEREWVPSMKLAMNTLTPIKVGNVRKPLTNITNHDMEMMKKITDLLKY